MSELDVVTANGTFATAAASHLLKQGAAFIKMQPQETMYLSPRLSLTATLHKNAKQDNGTFLRFFFDGRLVQIFLQGNNETRGISHSIEQLLFLSCYTVKIPFV